jgi:hypothetical protein
MARCRHSVEGTTLHRDGGATRPQFFQPLSLELGCRLRIRRWFHVSKIAGKMPSCYGAGRPWARCGLDGTILACSDCWGGMIAQVRSGPPGNTTLTENRNDVLRLLTVTARSATHIARAELLMLLEAVHGKLNICFEDLRRLPQTTARFEARNRQSMSLE